MAEGTISAQLRHWSLNDPEKAAFIFRRERPCNWRLVLTRRETFTLAARYASILRGRGIKHGDVICNTLPNGPERLITDLGIILAGAVTLNGMVFLADGSGLVTSLRKSSSVALVLDPALPNNALTVLQDKLESRTELGARCPQAPRFRHLLLVDCGSGVQDSGHKPFLEELRQAGDQFVAQVEPDHLAYVMTTSGSTGFSKLVPRTHASFLELADAVFTLPPGFRTDDTYFNDRSLGWFGGCPLLYVRWGLTRVLTDLTTASDDPLKLVWRVVREEACTAGVMVPLHLDMSLARPELWQGTKPTFRFILTGGQPVRQQHMAVIGKLTDSLAVIYGMTETGVTTTCLMEAKDIPNYTDCDNGTPLDSCSLKLVNENGTEVEKTGDVGEVLVKGPAVFTGYLDLDQIPPCPHAFTEDGWFSTGDVAFKDNRGHIFVTCRKSNAIMHGAFVLYPGWLESKIVQCPGIQNAIIVPIPDPSLWQELCACVVLKPGVKMTEDDVREFCKTLFAVPDTAETNMVPRFYVFFNSYPTTTTGKVDRKAIRKAALEKLGIEDSAIHGFQSQAKLK